MQTPETKWFQTWLKATRARLGLSREIFARRYLDELGSGAVEGWEKGASPKLESIIALGHYFPELRDLIWDKELQRELLLDDSSNAGVSQTSRRAA